MNPLLVPEKALLSIYALECGLAALASQRWFVAAISNAVELLEVDSLRPA
jgi:hypothetical protein